MAKKRQARPMKPDEVGAKKRGLFPSEVFHAFDELIAKDFQDGQAVVGQWKVIDLMVKKGLKRDKIFSEGWLNIESVYEDAGWDVYYDKPGFNEDYEPSFHFTKKE